MMRRSEQRRTVGGPVAEHDSPVGEPSSAPSGTPWGWSSVRERPTGERPARVLPSAVGAEMSAALQPPAVPAPAPGVEGAAARRERRTTWSLRVAGLAFLALVGGGLLSTDVGAGLRDDVLAQLPDMLVPGAGTDPIEPTGLPEAEPGTSGAADLAQPQPAPVVPGVVLAPSPPTAGPLPSDPDAEVPGAPEPPVGPVDPVVPPVDPPVDPPSPTRDGTVSAVLDPVVSGVAGLADGVTGGVTDPVTGAVVPLTDGLTDLLDGVVDPVLGLLGGVATGR